MPIDYTKYTLSELLEAQASIDGDLYPDNKAALTAEISRRKEEGEFDQFKAEGKQRQFAKAKKDIRTADRVRQVVAVALLLSGAVFLALGRNVEGGSTWLVMVLYALVTWFVVASIAAGAGLFYRKRWAFNLAIALMALQVIWVKSNLVTFYASSGLHAGLYARIDDGGDLQLGGQFFIGPGLDFGLGQTVASTTVGVNLVALFFIAYLLLARRKAVD